MTRSTTLTFAFFGIWSLSSVIRLSLYTIRLTKGVPSQGIPFLHYVEEIIISMFLYISTYRWTYRHTEYIRIYKYIDTYTHTHIYMYEYRER